MGGPYGDKQHSNILLVNNFKPTFTGAVKNTSMNSPTPPSSLQNSPVKPSNRIFSN